MATPTINTFRLPQEVKPGEAFEVVVQATDPDTFVGRLKGIVTDQAGNQTEVEGMVAVKDAIAYELVDVDGVGFTIEPRAGHPGVFDVTAPGAEG
jgi:hypothetical protein